MLCSLIVFQAGKCKGDDPAKCKTTPLPVCRHSMLCSLIVFQTDKSKGGDPEEGDDDDEEEEDEEGEGEDACSPHPFIITVPGPSMAEGPAKHLRSSATKPPLAPGLSSTGERGRRDR